MLFSVHAAFITHPPPHTFFAPRRHARKKLFFILGFSFSQCVSPEVDGSVHLGPPSGSSERRREVLCGDEGVEK